MARSACGAFIGFLVGLVGGIVIVYYIYPSLDLDDVVYFLIFIFYSVVIIGLLSILGAIIGYFFGNNFYESMTKLTESSGVGGDTTVLLYVFLRLFCVIFLISGGILFFVDVGLPGFVLDWDGPAIYINPLSITLLVIGVILLVVFMGRECFEDC